MWCLDDFTDANGATRIVPGSHKLQRSPNTPKSTTASPSRRPRGSAIVFHGGLWHQKPAPRHKDEETPRHYHLLLPPVYAPARELLLSLTTPKFSNGHAASQAALGIHHVAGRRRCDQTACHARDRGFRAGTTTRSWFPSSRRPGGRLIALWQDRFDSLASGATQFSLKRPKFCQRAICPLL